VGYPFPTFYDIFKYSLALLYPRMATSVPPVVTRPTLQSLGFSNPRRSTFTIARFHDPDKAIYNWKIQGHSANEAMTVFRHKLIKVTTTKTNSLLNDYKPLGWAFIAGIGSPTTPFSFTNSRLGVSDDPSSPTDTSVTVLNPAGGTTQIYMQTIDLTYPQITTNATTGDTATWEASYPTGIAEFDWTAFGVDNDAADGPGIIISSYDGINILLMNRLVTDEGTKGAGQLWILTLNITQY
jgi:hypothetical protein